MAPTSGHHRLAPDLTQHAIHCGAAATELRPTFFLEQHAAPYMPWHLEPSMSCIAVLWHVSAYMHAALPAKHLHIPHLFMLHAASQSLLCARHVPSCQSWASTNRKLPTPSKQLRATGPCSADTGPGYYFSIMTSTSSDPDIRRTRFMIWLPEASWQAACLSVTHGVPRVRGPCLLAGGQAAAGCCALGGSLVPSWGLHLSLRSSSYAGH
mmetsp:Transcript_27560/g.70207  ORF Transcript_27560/g.70207 Transcript_27560/m.70207 type:complete len:210 (-) Transcript_27560:414-1043(-)